MHDSFLRYRNGRWLNLSAALAVACVIAYAVDDPPGGRGGGTWLGYALGGLAAALMLWLTWFGVRKRRYQPGGAPLRGWLSAHVYLGLTLLVIVPLHCAFRFGWNVHTLAFVLMAAVIVTGMIGVAIYAVVPERMTRNRPGERLVTLFEQVGALDAECKVAGRGMPTAVAAVVADAIDSTRLGGGLLRQLRGTDPSGPTTRAIAVVQNAITGDAGPSPDLQHVLENLAARRTLLERIRRDIQLKAWLDVWLIVHVPLALASLAAVAVHVFVVWYYR